MFFVNRSAAVLKPTQKFLDWLKAAGDNLPELNLAQLRSNCTVYLVPEADTPEAVVAYFDEHYERIFAAELAGWEEEPGRWPQDRSLAAFWAFFDVEIHDVVLDMEAEEIQTGPVFDNMM